MAEDSENREPNARTPAALLATAYHEAGHVVVAAHFGLPITDVTIVPSGDALGKATHPSPLMLDLEGTAAARRRAAREMIVAAYAGLAAQRLVEPQAPDFHGSADEENAMCLSQKYAVLPRNCGFVGDEAHEAYLEKLRGEAKRLVRRLRMAIDALARELLGRKTIPGGEAVSIADRFLGKG